MKNKSRIAFCLSVCAMIGLTTLTSRSVLSSQGNGGRLEGTWNVVLTPRNCATGDPLPFPPSFPEIVTFMTGGNDAGFDFVCLTRCKDSRPRCLEPRRSRHIPLQFQVF
jgi:hypothetical protein